MSRTCAVCGEYISPVSRKFQIQDGVICKDCWHKAGFGDGANLEQIDAVKEYSAAHIRDLQQEKAESASSLDHFQSTQTVGDVSFDNQQQVLRIFRGKSRQEIIRYDQLKSFHLVDLSPTVQKKSIKQVIVNGAAGNMNGKDLCSLLQIQIELQNSASRQAVITFIPARVKRSSKLYKEAFANAKKTMDLLEAARSMAENS